MEAAQDKASPAALCRMTLPGRSAGSSACRARGRALAVFFRISRPGRHWPLRWPSRGFSGCWKARQRRQGLNRQQHAGWVRPSRHIPRAGFDRPHVARLCVVKLLVRVSSGIKALFIFFPCCINQKFKKKKRIYEFLHHMPGLVVASLLRFSSPGI